MRRLAILCAVFLALSVTPAVAGRLGGAYRGPYGPRWDALGSRGRGAVQDVLAYWPFWFEHEKEWILSDRLRRRARRAPPPDGSSPRLFRDTDAPAEDRIPITPEVRRQDVRPVLLEGLTDADARVRDAAVLALGKLGTEGTVLPIAGRLADPDRDVREDALIALGLTRRREALPHLLETFKGSDPGLSAAAALGLGLLGVRDAVPALLDEYGEIPEEPGTEERAACIAFALGALGDETIADDLAAPLPREGRRELKIHVATALGRLGGERPLAWLLAAFRDRDRRVRGAVALALADFPEDVAAHRLEEDGLSAGDRMTQLYSIQALGRIAGTRPRDDLLRKEILKELREPATCPPKNQYATMHAALALGLMGDTGANPFFLEQMHAERRLRWITTVHTAMAMALGLTGDRDAVPYLREIVGDGRLDGDYRGYAAFALGLAGDRASKDVILRAMREEPDRTHLVRSGCWAVALLGGKEDVPALLEVLRLEGDEAKTARGAAALALGILGDASTAARLVEIVREPPSATTRAFAITALGCLVDPDPVPRLPRLFHGLHYRHQPQIVSRVLTNL